MNPFQYERASDVNGALTARARAGAQYLGGGTNLVDLMRETIEHPDVLVDVTGLSRDIEETKGGGLKIGAGVKNTVVCHYGRVGVWRGGVRLSISVCRPFRLAVP